MKKLKIMFVFLFLTLAVQAQYREKKWYSISGNDIATMSLELAAGYAQGWREEVLYHPNALFNHFPNLNRNFWDNRLYPEGGHIKDANHTLKAIITSLHIAAVVIKVSDYKQLKGGKKFLKIPVKQIRKFAFDFAKNYIAYQGGFYLGYNVTHRNKL